MYFLMIKFFSVAKWVLFPIAAIVCGVKYTEYADYFETHWHTLIGGTVGTGFAGVDLVQTAQNTTLTYDFGHDMYMVGFACFKAVMIVFFSLGTTKVFKWLWPDAKVKPSE